MIQKVLDWRKKSGVVVKTRK